MPSSRNGSKKSASTQVSSSGTAKWTKSIRALPSNSESNDYLKPDYIEVNLNNSRKLIENLNQLSESSTKSVELTNELNERLLLLNNVLSTLSWLPENDV